MKIKVKKKYIDKYDKKLVKEGSIIDVSEKRFEEIITSDSEAVEPITKKKSVKK